MPTIHLSVPDRQYEKLRKAAESYGIQVTDLIKIFIKHNIDDALQGRLPSTSGGARVEELEEKISRLERELKEKTEALEQAVKTLSLILKGIDRRLGQVELDVEELKEAVGMESVFIEPEILSADRR